MSLVSTPGALVQVNKSQLAAREIVGGTYGKSHKTLVALWVHSQCLVMDLWWVDLDQQGQKLGRKLDMK